MYLYISLPYLSLHRHSCPQSNSFVNLFSVYFYNLLPFKRIKSIYSTSRGVFPRSVFRSILYLYKNGRSYCCEDAMDTHVSCDVIQSGWWLPTLSYRAKCCRLRCTTSLQNFASCLPDYTVSQYVRPQILLIFGKIGPKRMHEYTSIRTYGGRWARACLCVFMYVYMHVCIYVRMYSCMSV